MKPIPETFKSDGFTHTLVERDRMLAIFSKGKPPSQPFHWEVVRLHVEKEKRWKDGREKSVTPEHEAYPSSEQWGERGWTCMSLDEARKKLQEWRSLPRTKPKQAGLGDET